MMISTTNTAIAAAMACALLAGKANADGVPLPHTFTDNPAQYRTLYDLLTKEVAKGSVAASRPAVVIWMKALDLPMYQYAVERYQQRAISFDQLTYIKLEDYAPPPIVTAPMMTLTPSTPATPAQQPPQDHGAAAAAKTAQLNAAQTAGIAAGQAARPIAWTALQPSTPPLAWTTLQPSTPTQASLNDAVESARHQVDSAQASVDYAESQPKHRIDIDPKQMAHRMVTPDGSAPHYLQDANGYYDLAWSEGELYLLNTARAQLADKQQLLAEAEKAAADYTAAHPATQTPAPQQAVTQQPTQASTTTPAVTPPTVQPAQQPTQTASTTTPTAADALKPEQPATPPAAILASMKATPQAAKAQAADTASAQQPTARSSATADTVCTAAATDAIDLRSRYAANLAENNTHNIIAAEQRIEANTAGIEQANRNFQNLRSEVENNKAEARAGVAGVAAMANIPTARTDEHVMIGAGLGTFKGEQALAVGASINLASNIAVKLSVSSATNGDAAAGVGAGIGF